MKIKGFSMRITGLEPARHGHQNLNLARLPIPPYPRKLREAVDEPHKSERCLHPKRCMQDSICGDSRDGKCVST